MIQKVNDTLRRCGASEIISLRHRVLRPGLPVNEVIFEQDDWPESRHYGAFDETGAAIACVSLLPSRWQEESAWQLRAMAVDPSRQGRGLGSRLWLFLLADIGLLEQPRLLWCNARSGSASFYKTLGWRPASEEFDNGNAGMSLKMLFHLENV